MTEVILKREVPRLGDRGDVVRVADGYARNYLFPQQLAIPATTASKKNIKDMKAAADRDAARLKGDAEKLAGLLRELAIKIVGRAGESDQLFGSVTSRDIAAELDKRGYAIDRHKIYLERPIRMIGDYHVTIHLHRDIDVELPVKVRAEGREDQEIVAKAPAAEAVAEEEEQTETVEVAEAAETVEASDDNEPLKAGAKSGKTRGKSSKKGSKQVSKKEDEDEE